MPTENEAARLAAAINFLRPDWPAPSIRTLIVTRHRDRPLHDLAVALAYVATDCASRTPARINEPGPWWQVTAAPVNSPADRRPCIRCSRPHPDDEHCPRLDPHTATRGAAAARAALHRPEETASSAPEEAM